MIDTHIHLDDEAFSEDRTALIEGMADHGVELAVNIGADMESSLRSVRLAEEHASIYAVVGVHPSSTGQMKDSELEELRRLARHPKVSITAPLY